VVSVISNFYCYVILDDGCYTFASRVLS